MEVIVFANWKMNKLLDEGKEFIEELVGIYGVKKGLELIMCVPCLYIGFLSPLCEDTCIGIGSENIFYEEAGQFTGEISAPMLVSVGCRYALIGHSERRKYFGENDRDVNKKMRKALRHGLIPVVCIGETREDRDGGKMFDVLDRQTRECIRGLESGQKCHVAYEPRWAIGTGETPEYGEIEEAHQFIGEKLGEHHGPDVRKGINLLYGGSVSPENVFSICSLEHVDGVGFGGCSLDIDCFTRGIDESLRAESA